ncbi:MAG: hypothetical protein IIB77_02215 [Proteobacteria bacterium]|nr:hypothetical protein [Pseudomonadota bacterium]
MRLTLLTIMLTLPVAAMLLHALEISSLTAVQSSINGYKPALTVIRLTVIGLIAFGWPRLIQYAHQKGQISTTRKTQLSTLRWRAVGWLLIIELLLGQNLVGRLLTALDGGAA